MLNRKYLNRVVDSLCSNATSNQLDSMIRNYRLISEDKFNIHKNELLLLSIKSLSKDCVIFLLEKGANFDPFNVLKNAKYNNIIPVYNLVVELLNKYPESSSVKLNKFKSNIKQELLIRILDPSKIAVNHDRMQYVLDNITFFGVDEVNKAIENITINKSDKKYAQILRQMKFYQLGI